jgi:hypothetical protein
MYNEHSQMTDTGEQKKALTLRLGAEKWIDFRESKNLVADVVAATDGLGPHCAVIVSAATVSFCFQMLGSRSPNLFVGHTIQSSDQVSSAHWDDDCVGFSYRCLLKCSYRYHCFQGVSDPPSHVCLAHILLLAVHQDRRIDGRVRLILSILRFCTSSSIVTDKTPSRRLT